MRALLEEFGTSLAVATVLHAILILFLVFSLDRTVPITPMGDEVEVIEASVVDETLIEAELERIRETERLRIQEIEDAQRQAERLAAERAQEERRLQELREQQARERRQAEAERERRQREQAEREAREQAERERQAELERQRQAEAERQRQAEAERQRQAEAERQRQAEAERERRRIESLRQQYLSQYVADIRAKVERSWIRPDRWPAGTSCTVRVSQIPGGDVVQVRIVQSCGDPVLDRSVENAVLRASPLPIPPDPAVFQREIDFVFRPVD